MTTEQSLASFIDFLRACTPAKLRQLAEEYEASGRKWTANLARRILADPTGPIWGDS